MPTAADYETPDAAYVRSLFIGWTPDPLPSAGWAGIAEEGKALVPNPVPSGQQGAPTVYAVWGLRYTRTVGCYEGLVAPVRYGRLVISRFMEADGVDEGPLRLLRTALVSTLEDAPEGALEFDTQAAVSAGVGDVPGWLIRNLVVPFVGA